MALMPLILSRCSVWDSITGLCIITPSNTQIILVDLCAHVYWHRKSSHLHIPSASGQHVYSLSPISTTQLFAFDLNAQHIIVSESHPSLEIQVYWRSRS